MTTDRKQTLLNLAAAVLLTACGESTPVSDQPRPVRVAEARSADLLKQAVFNATIKAERETPVAFQVGGRLVVRGVREGSRVESGTALFELDQSDFALEVGRLQAERIVAQAELKTATADLQRIQQLLQQQFVSPTDLDRAENRVQAAQGRAGAVDAALALAQRQLTYTRLSAPFSGQINHIGVEEGQMIAAGEPLAILYGDQLEVVFQLPVQYAEQVKVGGLLDVSIWNCRQCATTATVSEIGSATRENVGTLVVRGVLADSHPHLRVGMSGRVRLTLGLPSGGVVIPQQALVSWKDRPAVWVVDAGGNRAVPQIVEPGEAIDDQVVIRNGLTTGTRVVTAGQHVLSVEQPIRLLD
ncbi:MAG TPA: hypothetical protein DCF45_07675 [Gammaproteobacteria bacterium]|nr:hypothetical protein [Gammaproteobacteria bacterium]